MPPFWARYGPNSWLTGGVCCGIRVFVLKSCPSNGLFVCLSNCPSVFKTVTLWCIVSEDWFLFSHCRFTCIVVLLSIIFFMFLLLLLLLFICSIPLSICLICIHFIFISLFHRYSYLLACLFKHLNIRVYRKCSVIHGNLLERVICNLLNYEIVLIKQRGSDLFIFGAT